MKRFIRRWLRARLLPDNRGPVLRWGGESSGNTDEPIKLSKEEAKERARLALLEAVKLHRDRYG